MATYAFIPARGGSERVPGKNWEPMLSGRSLVDIAIQCALLADVDEVVVSTDVDVARYGLPLGVKVHARKPEHATDTAQIEDAILDWGAARGLHHADLVVLLQPTSPLRRPSTVRTCIEQAASTITLDARWPFRGELSADTFPEWGDNAMLAKRGHVDRPRSQCVALRAEENGCVYAFRWGLVRRIGRRLHREYRAIPIPWWEAFEIDTPEDVEVAQALWPVFGGRP